MQRIFIFLLPLFWGVSLSAAEFREVLAERYRVRDGIGGVLEKLSKGDTVRVAYLGGSITAAKELAEPKYQGTNVWFGQLMLLGELVER